MSDNNLRSYIDNVHFGTDGWRAIIDDDFNLEALARTADATARAYHQLLADPKLTLDFVNDNPNAIIIGYDCRLNAGKYAAFFAEIVASHGFDVLVSDRYCPTPTLCFSVANNPGAVGGIMITASHNPAEYLGVKLRMSDGGASPAWFSDIVESLLEEAAPAAMPNALAVFDAATSASPSAPATPIEGAHFDFADIMSDYLKVLQKGVDSELIRNAKLSVVLDPMYGSGRGYLANLLTDMGVTVVEIHGESDPTFAGLHPEPIMPWVSEGAAKVAELGYAACLVNDGDADRIGAIDEFGNYVTSHRIVTLLIAHLVEDRGMSGRVVRTSAGSNLIKRQCERLGLELATKPIGFKWVYEEMLLGDVLIGGEESGGFGIPGHVRERDGLLMALLLVEMMAVRGKTLAQLVADQLELLGVLEYSRNDLRLLPEQQQAFLDKYVRVETLDFSAFAEYFAPLGEQLIEMDRSDGIMLRFASDAWLLARPSGTEPLVRVYAEATDFARVDELLEVGVGLARGDIVIG